MHMHGHHFRVIERNGKAVFNAPWRDTELVDVGEKVRIAFIADNPGKWLFHCHMLEHHMSGMGTWIAVA
jgi:FtsP/CotA-like multicopper oxidase with cupredoxin domain